MKKIFSSILVLTLFISCVVFLIGCEFQPQGVENDDAVKKEDFYGSYHSIYVDSQTKKNSAYFELEVKSDGTFYYKRTDTGLECSGEWRSYNEDGTVKLLCTASTSGLMPGTLNVWNPYFTLTMADDGTLIANAPLGTGFSKSFAGTEVFYNLDLVSAFGIGALQWIQLVIFEKNDA